MNKVFGVNRGCQKYLDLFSLFSYVVIFFRRINKVLGFKLNVLKFISREEKKDFFFR